MRRRINLCSFNMGNINTEPDIVMGDNVILYTTSDNNVYTIETTGSWGSNIVSNTYYTNAKGVIMFDGDVTTIPDNAFSHGNKEKLLTINIPKSVKSIGYHSFYSCNNLNNINIPDNVTSIGKYAFGFCHNLQTIILPSSIKTISDNAFCTMFNLKEVYVNATTPPQLGEKVFFDNPSSRIIYVPSSSLSAYKSASGWSDYANNIKSF